MANIELRTVEQRIPPVRGLVLTRNASGQAFDMIDVKRWIRVNRDIHKVEKIDVFARGIDRAALVSLVQHAKDLHVRLSLRTDCSEPPNVFDPPANLGLLDIFLTPRSVDAPHLGAWLNAARDAGLPVRLQLQAPFAGDFDPEQTAKRIAQAGVVVLNVTLADPFLELPACPNTEASRRTVKQMNALVKAAEAEGVEANLQFLPLCLVEPENLVRAANSAQFALDHQQYHRLARKLAAEVFRISPNAAGKVLTMSLARNSWWTWYIDNKLLTWLLEGPRRHLLLLVWRKLTRKLRVVRGEPKPIEESAAAYEREVQRVRENAAKQCGPICAHCSLRRICDHDAGWFKTTLPGLEVAAQQISVPGAEGVENAVVPSPMYFCGRQLKHYDSIDAARITSAEGYLGLAKEASRILRNDTPTREIDSYDYEIVGQWTHHMPGGNRWHSFTSSEKLSTVLARVVPPFTIAMTLGGGIADFAGFSFGRHCKLLCPMETYIHQIALHVNAEGNFVMLRDGVPVRPTEFEDVQYVPARLAGVLEPRIALWNIDGAIVTQTVLLWEGQAGAAAELTARIKYSVVIVSTRYSRRLQAVLTCLAHQEGIDFSMIEVIVSYVPGIDATDDIIESMKLIHPGLRIVRAPFVESDVRSKGFLINESLSVASGEWILLLDSDILLHPSTFARMEEVAADAHFMCPEGRKMLEPTETARILLGEVEPWRDWEKLVNGPGELRCGEADGVPIGFFQCVRRNHMEQIPYQELDHFEGADWIFGDAIRRRFGKETRLAGLHVLHLDHGGSQWYGATKQR